MVWKKNWTSRTQATYPPGFFGKKTILTPVILGERIALTVQKLLHWKDHLVSCQLFHTLCSPNESLTFFELFFWKFEFFPPLKPTQISSYFEMDIGISKQAVYTEKNSNQCRKQFSHHFSGITRRSLQVIHVMKLKVATSESVKNFRIMQALFLNKNLYLPEISSSDHNQ